MRGKVRVEGCPGVGVRVLPAHKNSFSFEEGVGFVGLEKEGEVISSDVD